MSALPRSKVPQHSRGRAAGQPVALRRPWARTAYRGGALHCGCAVDVELVVVARVGCRGVGWLPRRAPVSEFEALNRETAAVIQRSIHFL